MNLLSRGAGILSVLGGLRKDFKRCFAAAPSKSKAKAELAYPKPASKEADELPMIADRSKVIRVEQTTAEMLSSTYSLRVDLTELDVVEKVDLVTKEAERSKGGEFR